MKQKILSILSDEKIIDTYCLVIDALCFLAGTFDIYNSGMIAKPSNIMEKGINFMLSYMLPCGFCFFIQLLIGLFIIFIVAMFNHDFGQELANKIFPLIGRTGLQFLKYLGIVCIIAVLVAIISAVLLSYVGITKIL